MVGSRRLTGRMRIPSLADTSARRFVDLANASAAPIACCIRPSARVERRRQLQARIVGRGAGVIADRIREARDAWGGESILPYSYGGSNGLLTQDTSDATLFRRLGASRLARPSAQPRPAPPTWRSTAEMPSVVYEDFAEAKIIVIWGANPSASGIHLLPYIREAKRRGARLVVIDPRTTPLAKQADIHLAVRPGTDLPVALAIHRYLFEEGHADTSFLAAHTRGADRLRERAHPWTFERAAHEAGIDAAALRAAAGYASQSRDHPVRLGTGAQPQRRQRIARHSRSACSGREIWRARRRLYDEQFRIVGDHANLDRQRRAGDACDQHEPARTRARGQRSARESAVRLQQQRGRRRPISAGSCAGSSATICLPSSSSRS